VIVVVPLADQAHFELELSAETAAIARALSFDHELYFQTETGFEIGLADLVQSRVRPEGVAAAARYMLAAARGEMGLRAPVSVRRRATGGFTVLDGNSTVTVARAAGWPTIWGAEDGEAGG
jgi:hypothetical protein